MGDRIGEGVRETDTRFLNGRSTLVPLFEAIAVVAFSESDSTISPSEGGDAEGEVIMRLMNCRFVIGSNCKVKLIVY